MLKIDVSKHSLTFNKGNDYHVQKLENLNTNHSKIKKLYLFKMMRKKNLKNILFLDYYQ